MNYFWTHRPCAGVGRRSQRNSTETPSSEKFPIATNCPTFPITPARIQSPCIGNHSRTCKRTTSIIICCTRRQWRHQDISGTVHRQRAIDFLMEERKAKYPNLGLLHGTTGCLMKYIGHARPDTLGFRTIQLNYADWKRHVSGNNVNAEYLYGELLNATYPPSSWNRYGRTAFQLNDHLWHAWKQHRPQRVRLPGFPLCRELPKVLTVIERHDVYGNSRWTTRTYSPFDPCTEEEMALLEDTAQVMLTYPIIPCNDCKYCMPCPYGLTFPPFCCITNRCANEGNIPKSSRDENHREARRAFPHRL